MDAAEANRIQAGGDDMDTSETVNGKRGQPPVEGAMDSEILSQ